MLKHNAQNLRNEAKYGFCILALDMLYESVKRDLKDWNISKEIALDRSAWRLAINVPEP